MLSSLFVDRPRLAMVISIVITIAGLIAIKVIPVAQFPDIVPPQVQVPHRGSQLDVQYLRQIAATLVQMAHRQAATPMIGIV